MRINLLNKLNLDNTFEISQVGIADILSNKPKEITFTVPLNGIEKNVELEISNIFAEGFKVTNEFGETLNLELGVHYRGKVSGNSNSIVALTFTEGGFDGLIHEENSKFDIKKLGRFAHSAIESTENYDFNCLTLDTDIDDSNTLNTQITKTSSNQPLPKGLNPYVTTVANYCIRAFWEVDYDIYSIYGANTTSYITSLFNASAALFNNDGIYVILSEIKIWTLGNSVYRTYGTPVPNCDCSTYLYNYRDYYVNNSLTFNGNFAHLLSFNYPCTGSVSSGSRCGVSWVNGLCLNQNKFAFSQLYYTVTDPSSTVYSWNVSVITHEQGHQFGSEHTHACAWNGNNTAIDGCVPVSPAGGCPQPGLPAGGGTIMSYCHQVPSVGINFALGFGPQPQARIVSRVNAKTCLLPCGPLPTPTPTQTNTLTPGLSPNPTPTKTQTRTPTLTPNWICKITTQIAPPFGGNSVVVSGVTFTSTYSGAVFSPFFWIPDCLGETINGPEFSNGSGLPYNYNLISSTPLNSITIRLGNIRSNQTITLTTNSGTTSLSICQGCCVNISGNTLISQSCTYSSVGVGLKLIINSTQPFTSLNISGVNPSPTSGFGVFFDIINFTTFVSGGTPTPTPTMTQTPTITPTIPLPCNSYSCNNPIRPPMTVNGIFITSELTGTSVNVSNAFASCNNTVISPPNILNLGFSSPFTYKLNFSVPITSVVMYITNAGTVGADCTENFTILTNSGNPNITSPTNCFTTINNNIISINTMGSPQVGAGGGIFLISNNTPFTSVSIIGQQTCAGSYIVFCADSLICPQVLPTQTPTLTPTNTPTLTKTATPTLTTNTQIIPKVDFVCVHWYKGVNSTQFINDMTDIINLYNKPIWVTEFAPQDPTSSQNNPNLYNQTEVNNFINTVIPWMNTNSMVERYAWRDSKVGTSAIFTIDGQLTETGITYRDAQ